ncbi:hypothetical protein E4U40_007290 [Claviceps sp. LM458 group G5]|nr:hypothetical protein E4U40_007290 [Claviceps sp. LM458 group G5]
MATNTPQDVSTESSPPAQPTPPTGSGSGSPSPPQSPSPSSSPDSEPLYGGYSRFEIELEFVQALANPYYLNHIASQKLLSQPAFVAYLDYLQYWTRPPYLKYLTYPGPTLRHLELLQEERFRQDIMSPDLVRWLVEEDMRAAVEWHRESGPGVQA